MHRRLLAICSLASFAAGLSVASFAGFREFLPGLLAGAWVTLQITVAGCALAVVMGLIAGLCKLYGMLLLRWLAVAYIEVFRGTSALVQLFWLFFVLPHFGVHLSPMVVGIVALGLNVGAYGAEVVRGAILAVPPWGNLFIELLKASALVSLITLSDLTFKASQMNQTTFRTVEIFSLVLAIYLGISLLITLSMRMLEARASAGLARGRTG